MTKAEEILWRRLKKKQLNGYKFRRQYSIKKFIVDFYCPEAKLVLEIDGDVHFIGNRPDYDQRRQKFIESLEIKVLRFYNIDIYYNLEGVIQMILDNLSHIN